MSVRDAAGRSPRLTRGGPATDVSRAGRRRHGAHARPAGSARRAGVGFRPAADRGAAGPGSRAGHRPPGPLLACLVAIGIAIAEALSAGSGGHRRPVVAAGSPSGVTTAGGPGRVASGPDLAAIPNQPGDAPRRAALSSNGGSASDLAAAAAAAAAAEAADPLPSCTHADVPAPQSGLDDWATTIIDTAFVLPAGYRPPDLVPVGRAGIDGWGFVRSVAVDDLRALAHAAAKAGNPVAVQSAYRTRERQAEVFADWTASSGEAAARRFSARPGHSEHQLGTSLDLRAAAGGAPWSGAFGTTAAGRWLVKHAAEYGFVLSYPAGADAVTCYGAEAWHVRYVGRAIAARVAASGLPLRAWLWRYGGEH